MKKLFTLLTLIICIYVNGQNKVEIVNTSISSDKVNDIDKQLVEAQTQFRKDVDVAIRDLQVQIRALKKEVSDLKKRSDLKAFAELLGVKIFTIDELPKDLKADELGIAFVKDENDVVSLYFSINNTWKKILL